MTKKFQRSLCCLFIFVATFLIGCGGNIDRTVTFYKDEAWQANIEFSIPGEMLALIGSPEALEADIMETVADWEANGADVSWESRREETTIIYTFDVKGEGFALLNEIVFENRASLRAAEVEGERQIFFSYRTSSDLSGANTNNVTLNGRNIISSNGEQMNSGTVQWTNYGGQLEAVLTEKSRFGFGSILLILLLVGTIGGGGWFVWQRSQQPQMAQPAQPAPAAAAYCSSCGAAHSPQAKFCPSCGQPQ